MKKNTSRHPKMLAFARSLEISRVWARGIMGELWEWAGDFALFGDIGKHTNQAIADAVDWTGNADRLIGAMIDAGWIDEVDDDRRLMLHDWEDGCDEWIKKRLSRSRRGETADNGRQRLPTADNGNPVREGKGREGKVKSDPNRLSPAQRIPDRYGSGAAQEEDEPGRVGRTNGQWMQIATARILDGAGVSPERAKDQRRPVGALLRKIVDREDRADILDGWVTHARECADGSCQNPMAAWTARVKADLGRTGE